MDPKSDYAVLVFGLLKRFGAKRRKEGQARNKELAGDLHAAVRLFLDAELPQEAARVLLLEADAEADPKRRMMMCAQAARVGVGTPEGEEAAKRKAVLAFDLLRDAKGTPMHGEMLRIAAELEKVGEWERAVDAYVLVGDTEAEIRVLEEAGAIERLEDRLSATSIDARRDRERAQLLRRIRDLDLIGERREALRCGRQWLEQQHDEQIQLEVDRVGSRLISGPVAWLEIRAEALRFVLGAEITIGRARADIIVGSNAVSRQHLRLFRRGGEPHVEDLDTQNGTLIAGARVTRPLPVGSGLELTLAGRVPCKLTPSAVPVGLVVEIGGERHLAPLGPLCLGDWQLVDAHDGDERFIVLRTPEIGSPPYMGGYRLGRQVELCVGDEIREQRAGEVVLAVPDPGRHDRTLR